MNKIKYVLGFVFDEFCENVILIHKNKPAWQAGKINGVGGKIEKGETPSQAMSREFREEVGVYIPHKDWTCFCEMNGKDFDVYCFKAWYDGPIESRESETVFRCPTVNIQISSATDMIPNLKWLIPMALDNDNIWATVRY